VRKARQAYGRVLRGDEEKGVRVLVDERYGETRYGGVNQYLGDGERDEFEVMSDAEFSKRMRLFWESVE
jgi:DNA excision repair protein ERCC-2